MPNLRFEVVHGLLPDAVRTAWREFSQRATPFATPAFFDAWCTAFSRERSGFVVVGFHGDAPQVVLPLWHPRADPQSWFGLGEFRADYTEAVAVTDNIALGKSLWSWLASAAPCRLVKLPRIPSDSLLARTAPPHDMRARVYDAATSLLRRGRARYQETRTHSEHPYADRAHVELLAQRLDSKETRRKINVLRRGGELTYEVLRGPAITARLPAFFDMHVAAFTGTGRASQFDVPAERAFYQALATSEALSEVLVLDVLAVGERPVAMHLGFQQHGRIYWYKPAFDLALAKGSPGRVLLANLFARAAREEVQCVDMLKGDEPYKNDWANRVRPTLTSTIIERSLREIVEGIAKQLRRKMVTSIGVAT